MARTKNRDQEEQRIRDEQEKKSKELFIQYRENRTISLRNQLVSMHQNLVRFLASKFAGRGIPKEDLVQVGIIGLIKAVDRFDLDRGTMFSTYATPTITGEIRRHFRDKGWIVKVPRKLQALGLAVSTQMEKRGISYAGSNEVSIIADDLGVTEEDILEALKVASAYRPLSLDDLRGNPHDENEPTSLMDSLYEISEDMKKLQAYFDLKLAVEQLNPRLKTIIIAIYDDELSQREAGRKVGVSQMHVSRLLPKAREKLRKMLENPDYTDNKPSPNIGEKTLPNWIADAIKR